MRNQKYYRGKRGLNMMMKLLCAAFFILHSSFFISCSDFFDQESDHVMFVDNAQLDNATDTIYYVTGIMKKMQSLADRTILLGEARGDLVDITEATPKDLRDVARFDIGDDNQYNKPSDYYAVINNCNYFLANADELLKNSRDEIIFKREIAAVKAFRAWTYLQLAMNYRWVIYVTEPILTKEAAEQMEHLSPIGINELCQRLINELLPIIDDTYLQYNGEHSFYGDIGYKTNSMFFYFPVRLLLAELNLWAGNYREAAEWYYRYISTRNGDNSTYPTGIDRMEWKTSSWTDITHTWADSWPASNDLIYGSNNEVITVIPGDSIPRNGQYLQLRNIFNSTDPVTNEYHEVSLVPSQALIDLSAAQVFCLAEGRDTIYAPAKVGTKDYQSGDLRLWGSFAKGQTLYNGSRVETQTIAKHRTRNAVVWRRQMVWLHMAEALNHAGYPRFAYQILARGLSDKVIREEVIPHYTADSVWIKTFKFPDERYRARTTTSDDNDSRINMQGIHSRGSGLAYINAYYQMPFDEAIEDSLEQIAYQQNEIDKMIADECALEFAFEGLRYYDLVRMALYRHEPSFLADRIYGRRGEAKRGEMEGFIVKSLYDENNWFLKWNDKLGIEPIKE